MQTRQQTIRADTASQARLQLVLIALAVWNALTFLLMLVNAGVLSVGDIDGVLGGRAVGGATLVLAAAYVYAARNPIRYRILVWLAALEQFIAMFSITFHWARGDVGATESFVPIIMSAIFLVLLIANLPRQTDTL